MKTMCTNERHVYPWTVASVGHKYPPRRIGLEQRGPHHHFI
jgi:hypothetical protein